MQSRSSLLCFVYGPSLFIDIAQRISILSWQGIAQSLPRYLYALQVYRFTDHLCCRRIVTVCFLPNLNSCYRELNTGVKTKLLLQRSICGLFSGYDHYDLLCFPSMVLWCFRFSVHHGYVSVYPLIPFAGRPFYRIGKFYEGINRRYTYIFAGDVY